MDAQKTSEATSSATFMDPVCGMKVKPERAAGVVEHKGKTYYFCSKSCVQKFSAEPEKYLDPTYKPMGMGRPFGVVMLGGIAPAKPTTSTAEGAAGTPGQAHGDTLVSGFQLPVSD